MSMQNANGDALVEEALWSASDFQSDAEVKDALLLIARELGFEFVRTNGGKRSTTSIDIRRIE